MNFPFCTEDEHFSVIEKFFTEKGPVLHQFESYEHMVHHTIQKIFDECTSISIETKNTAYKATFGQVYFEKASITDENRVLRYITPNEARLRDLTYDSPVFVDIKEEFWEKGEKVNQLNHPKVFMLRMPTMVRSSRCNLYGLSMKECMEQGECENDPGGYFIVNGKERALICQERLNYNQVYLFESNSDKYPHIAEIRSMSEETCHSVLLKAIIDKDFRNCCFSLPYMSKEVLAGTVFKALGFTNEQIYELINPYSKEEVKLTERLIRESMIYNTKEKAIKYISKSSIQKVEDSEERRIHYTIQVIENELFPHMGISTNLEKGILLGTMINKLFRVCLGKRTNEDRDNVSIKRIEGPGVLLSDLFRMCLKRYCDNLKKYLEKRQDIITAISRTNSITTAIKSPMCFVKGTLVSLSNGTSLPIESLKDIGNNVLGWNKDTGLLKPSIQTHFFNQGEKETIILTFEDGRTIQCTPDHKLLIFENEKPIWVEACSIPNGSRIISGPDYTQDIIGEDEKDWILQIDDKIFSMDNFENRQKTLAFARIIGLLMTDGCLKKDKGGAVYLGTLHDVNNFINDYKKITDTVPRYTNDSDKIYGSIYTIQLRVEITKILRKIEGITIGNSMTQKSTLPKFILDPACPKSIVREFLGAMFGGDGYCPRLDKRDGKRTCFQGVGFSWSIDEKYIDDLKETFNNLLFLIEKVGISGSYFNGPYKSKDKENRPFIRLHIPISTDFNRLIGFRYCINKSYKLTIINSYLRMEENIKRQHSFTVQKTNELIELYKDKKIKECLELAQKELKDKEYIMNEYYSLSNYEDIHKRRSKNRSKTLKNLQEKYGVISFEKFIEESGISSWFDKNYINERQMTELPIFTIKLVDISPGNTQTVYDITVEDTHSFLANGIVSSNCTGNWTAQKNTYVRTGVSQIMSRLTYPATISHLRRIVIPIGKEGKNVKIRQVHPTQCFFVDIIESPEGKGIGIIKNFSLLAKLSVGCNSILVRKLVEECDHFLLTQTYFEIKDPIMIYLNGTLIGITDHPDEYYQQLKNLKFIQNVLSDQVSFTMDKDEHEIRIFSDHGRFMRPLLTIENNELLLTKKDLVKSWCQMLEDDIIRYVDSNEVENSLIAMFPSNVLEYSNQTYHYCELHPSTMLGVCSAVIPYGEHNQCIFKNEPVYLADGTTKPICDIIVGDEVITFDPETQKQTTAMVSHTYANKTNKKMYELTTINGRHIQATYDHQFMTSEGWKRVEDIIENETLIGISMEPKVNTTTDITVLVYYEYMKYIEFNKNLVKFDEWKQKVIIKESTIFMPIVSKKISLENEICDITIDSPNQSFICGDHFCVHNCPRLVYEASMLKQALGVYSLAYKNRFDTISHVMQYPQKPLVETKYNKMLHYDEMLTGFNPIVAVACYTGWILV